MKISLISAKMLLLAASLLFVAGCIGQGASVTPTAKDEAIPALRDASLAALTHIRVIDGTGVPAREDQRLLIQRFSVWETAIKSNFQ
jgi:hypothetical protein